MGETPARIDRGALERIIQRAAELQTAERDIDDVMTPEEVLALGQDVGIPRRYLQQAMLEEQTRLPDQDAGGFLDRLVGPATVGADRVIRGEPEIIERSLLQWMEQNELLAVQRHQPGRLSWEPLGGIPAAIRRSTAALGSASRPFMLSKAELVAAAITPLEAGYCHVAMSASVQQLRTSYLGGGAAAIILGAGGTLALVVLSALLPVAILPIPLGLGIGVAVVRRFRPIPARLALGLERALDNLESGGPRAPARLPGRTPGLLEAILGEVRRSLDAGPRPRSARSPRGSHGG